MIKYIEVLLGIKRLFLLIFSLIFFSNLLVSQTVYNIKTYNGQTVDVSKSPTPCNAIFTSSDSCNSTCSGKKCACSGENYTITFYSGDTNKRLTFRFMIYSTTCTSISNIYKGDNLYTYDGPNTSGAYIGNLTQPAISTIDSIESTGSYITFHWVSTTSKSWWKATILCRKIPSAPKGCNGNPPASNFCKDAPHICNLNGYCGNTSNYYTPDFPGNFCHGPTCDLFGGGIHNNSWLSFTADSTEAVFDITVSNCTANKGLQLGIYAGNGCDNFVRESNPLYVSNGLLGNTTTRVTIPYGSAPELIPGQDYYIMFDGNFGDVCDYSLKALRGALIVSAGFDQTICKGDNVQMKATGASSYLWSPSNGLDYTNIPNPIATPTVTTTYTVSFTGGTSVCPKTATDDVVIYVITPPDTPLVSPNNPTICLGSNVKLEASGADSYTWSPSDGLSATNIFNPVASPTVTTTYTVKGINTLNNKSCTGKSAKVVVTVKNSKLDLIDTIPNQTICQGKTITFKVNASGSELSYQWTKGGVNIAGATNSIYSLSNPNPVDAGVYSCVVKNYCATKALPNFILTVNSPPISDMKFVKIIKNINDNVTLNVSPSGTKPFSYQWIKNGDNITGETNSQFNINSVTCGDTGIYSCNIKNSCGSITPKITELYVLCSRFKFAISGYVKYENKDSTAMSSRTNNTITNISLLNMGDTLVEKTETDDNGFYVFPEIVNGNYKLIGSTNKKWDGSNPVDALLINRKYIGLYSITDPLKKIAADINNDMQIKPNDALMINRRYIGLLNKFPISDWQFSNPAIKVEAVNIIKNIKAICAGDVNGSYSTIPAKIISSPIKQDASIKYKISSINFQNNRQFDIPVYLDDNVELGAMGIKLRIENGEWRITRISSNLQGFIYNISQEPRAKSQELSTNNEQLINIAWTTDNEGYTITPDKPIFVISCSLIDDSKGYQIPTSIFQLSSESVLADIDANLISTDKLVMPKIQFGVKSSEFEVKVYPNPFSNITNIDYTLPDDGNVEIELFNVVGAKIASLFNEKQNAGKYSLKYNGSKLREGIYYLRCKMYDLRFSNSSYTKTNIIMIAR